MGHDPKRRFRRNSAMRDYALHQARQNEMVGGGLFPRLVRFLRRKHYLIR